MPEFLSKPSSAFEGHHRPLSGPLIELALAVKTAVANGAPGAPGPFLVFDDASGRVIDLDLRGTKAEVVGRLARPPMEFVGRHAPRRAKTPESTKDEASATRGRGRPTPGIVAREVTAAARTVAMASQPARRCIRSTQTAGGRRRKKRYPATETTRRSRIRLSVHARDRRGSARP